MRVSEVRISVAEEKPHPPAAYLFDVSYREGEGELVADTDEDLFCKSLEALIEQGTGALVVAR
jgi:hypothetical protein